MGDAFRRDLPSACEHTERFYVCNGTSLVAHHRITNVRPYCFSSEQAESEFLESEIFIEVLKELLKLHVFSGSPQRR